MFNWSFREKTKNRLSSKRIIIHIGQHKTGSTAIQRLCAKASVDCCDFYYPQSGRIAAGHHKLPRIAQADDRFKSELLDSFLKECAVANAKNIVVSSEFFSSKNELDFDEVYSRNALTYANEISQHFGESTVVFYVRDQISSIDSRLSQAIKSRIGLKNPHWKPLLENKSLRYEEFTAFVKEILPDADLLPRIYDRKLMLNGDVRRDFLKAASLNYNTTAIPTERSNRKMDSPYGIAMAIEVNKLSIDKEAKQRLKKMIDSFFPDSFYSMISHEDAEQIAEYYKDSNSKFSEYISGDLPAQFFEVGDRQFPEYADQVDSGAAIGYLIKGLAEKCL